MKNSIFQIPRLFCLVAFIVVYQLNVNAKVITCSNGVVAGGAYSNLQSAINAANPGDTVYAMGSVNSYGNITINSAITLIGAGYNTLGTQQQLSTLVGDIYLNAATISTPGAAGAKIIGISMINNTLNGSDTTIKNITVSRCNINTIQVRGNGWTIKDCIMYIIYLQYNPVKSCFIANSFMYYGIRDQYSGFDNGLVIDHCIIEIATYTIKYATFTNNIFFNANQSGDASNKYDTYDNNITYYTSKDSLTQGTNGGSKNIYNPPYNKFFASGQYTSVGYGSILSYDWHLLSTCPGHNASTDGTDIGVYGGAYPMNFTGASTIPQITYLNINNAIIAPGGKLGVTFKARIQK